MTVTSPQAGPLSNESEGLCTDPTLNYDIFVDDARGKEDGCTVQGVIGATEAQKKLRPIRLIDYLHHFAMRYMPPGRLRVHLAGTGGADPWVAPTSRQVYRRDQLIAGGDVGLRNPQVYRGPMMIRATLSTGASHGVPLDVALAAQRIDETGAPNVAGQRLELLFGVAAPGWTAHDMGPPSAVAGVGRNCFLRVSRTAGAVTTKRWPEIPIADNTAASIILDLGAAQAAALLADLLATDAVEIVEPSVLVEGETDHGAGLRMVQILGRGTGVPALAALAAADQGYTFERIAFGELLEDGRGIGFDRCQFLGAVFGTQLGGDGQQLVNCSGGQFSKYGQSLDVLVPPSSRPDSGADPALPAPCVQLIAQSFRVGDQRGEVGHWLANGVFSLYQGAGDALRVVGPGSAFIQNGVGGGSAPCPYLGGDGAAGLGISVRRGGRAYVTGVGALPAPQTTLVGAGGALQCGAVGPIAYGVAAGALEGVPWGGNLHETTVTAGGPGVGVPVGDFSQILVG